MGRASAKQPVFSRREREVLTLLAKGMRRKEIAKQLTISEKTVSTYQANLIEKLGARNVMQLIRYAIDEGLVD
jgi:DNA-binding NarL/FixJ family response regulator